MKKIAITQRVIENTGYPEIRDALDVRWAELFSELGFLLLILPTYYDFNPYNESIGIDGIILSGGNDPSTISDSQISKDRDGFEKRLIQFAIVNDIPLFGVCRGMQIIGNYFGCTLEQVENHTAVRHKLTISENSKYYGLLEHLVTVNSYHNYALHSVSEGLAVSAISKDGIIEAIEHKEYRIFGQMWHPERENSFNPAEIEFIRQFFNDR